MSHNPGRSAASGLTLRVSAAALVRLLFRHPTRGVWMLALERKASQIQTAGRPAVVVKSQPFGGAVRILDPKALAGVIGELHFDSERSRAEQDLRLLIQPADWPALRDFCIQHLSHAGSGVLESDPARELAEELADALQENLQPWQYRCQPVETVVENEPSPTENIYARGIPTVRVYRIFEAVIEDAALIQAVLHSSEGLSNEALRGQAVQSSGRANAALSLPLDHLRNFYAALPPAERSKPAAFEGSLLDETTAAVLEGLPVPKYQRLP
jgi:hypothetical protein